jgi:hypothetical protein
VKATYSASLIQSIAHTSDHTAVAITNSATSISPRIQKLLIPCIVQPSLAVIPAAPNIQIAQPTAIRHNKMLMIAGSMIIVRTPPERDD